MLWYGTSSGAIPLTCLLFVVSTGEASTPWKRHVIDDSSQGADGVRLADFNADGRLDIVTGWEEGHITRLYLQPARKAIRQRWPAVTVGPAASVEDAVPVDVDGDGHLDIVSSTEGRTQTLWVHWAPAEVDSLLDPDGWKTEAIPDSINAQSWMYCLPMDVDGKRGIDLVTGSKGKKGAVGWWEAPKEPRRLDQWKYHRLIDAGWIMSILGHDIDGDGDNDVLVTDRRGPTRGLKWLEKPAASQLTTANAWTVHNIGGDKKEVMFAVLHDLDYDGSEDIAMITRNQTIDLYRRSSSRASRWKLSTVKNPLGFVYGKSVTAADLDLDGQVDLAVTVRPTSTEQPAVFMLTHNGNPFGGQWTVTDIGGPDGSKFDLIEAVDLDGDGDLDLITCEEVGNLGVFWYENPTKTPN